MAAGETPTPTNSPAKDLAHYRALPYAVEILPIPDAEGGGYVACIPRLGRYSAVGDGGTPEAAYAGLRAALPSLVADWLAQGVAIPEPDDAAPQTSYSGKLALRVPKSLHAQVAARARREGVSINQFIATTLAQEVGAASGR